jgi:transposase-like protein
VLRSSRRRMPGDDAEWRRRIAQALRDHGGNVSATARAFGLHHTQLRRLVERHGLCDRPEPSELATEDQDGVDVERGLPPAGD